MHTPYAPELVLKEQNIPDGLFEKTYCCFELEYRWLCAAKVIVTVLFSSLFSIVNSDKTKYFVGLVHQRASPDTVLSRL